MTFDAEILAVDEVRDTRSTNYQPSIVDDGSKRSGFVVKVVDTSSRCSDLYRLSAAKVYFLTCRVVPPIRNDMHREQKP